MIKVFLLLGSNLGNRDFYLAKAVGMIAAQIGDVEQKSNIYETESWGKEGEPDYLNQVIEVKTALSAEVLLKKLLSIEQSMGRERKERWGSRTLDIDILFYGDEVINKPELTVPHPRLHERRFTLEPLAELEPEFVHPVLQKSILQLKNELQDKLIVKKL